MLSSYIIENIKTVLGCEKLIFQKIDWIFSAANTNALVLDSEKKNDVHGILIFNIALSTDGISGTLELKDKKIDKVIYRNYNPVSQSFIAPFVYFVPDNSLNFEANIKMMLGFNYVTISKR